MGTEYCWLMGAVLQHALQCSGATAVYLHCLEERMGEGRVPGERFRTIGLCLRRPAATQAPPCAPATATPARLAGLLGAHVCSLVLPVLLPQQILVSKLLTL